MKALIYISEPTQTFSPSDLHDLNLASTSKNADHGITGFLCFHDNMFIQYFEGTPDKVDALFSLIQKDPRHKVTVFLIETRLIDKRFPSWNMKLIASQLLSDLSVEAFLHKQLVLMKSSNLTEKRWQDLIWRGVDIIATKQDKVVL